MQDIEIDTYDGFLSYLQDRTTIQAHLASFASLPLKIQLCRVLNSRFKNSNVPNERACTSISSKVCPLTSIEPVRQILTVINMHARLFSTLE